MAQGVRKGLSALHIAGMVRYSPQIANEICERLAQGESLRGICADMHMPTDTAVRMWALDNVEGFASQYARARGIGYERLADEIMQIADTPQQGETVVS